jgi:hypothetical protein
MKIVPSVFNTSLRLGLVGLCFFVTSCDCKKEESRSKESLPIESGGTQLTTNQNLMLDEILAIAGLERENFLDFVGGEQELANFLNSQRWLEHQITIVSNALHASDFPAWVVLELQGKKDLLAEISLRSSVTIPANEIPSEVLELGNPLSVIVTMNQKGQPYIRIVWRHMKESTWGIAAGEAKFSFADTNLVVGEWKPGMYVWLER